jgi:hypothetical protein
MLSKEQIEEQGYFFKYKGMDLWFEKDTDEFNTIQDFYGYKPYLIFLNYGLHDGKLHIKVDFGAQNSWDKAETLFDGECQDLETFELIQKLLHII